MDILEQLIARPGETQEGRLPEGLARGFLRIEDRDGPALYRFLQDFSKHVRFSYVSGGAIKDDLDWAPFFPDGKLPARLGMAILDGHADLATPRPDHWT